MQNPVIVKALRTPIGRARKGSLVTKDAFELARVVVRAVLDRRDGRSRHGCDS
jgi:acetyl-CoA acetyltransferase